MAAIAVPTDGASVSAAPAETSTPPTKSGWRSTR
jgi:hypothetical protein